MNLLDLSRFTAQTFATGLWEGFALTFAVALALHLLRGLGAKLRSAIWTITFALAAVLPFLHLPAPPEAAPSQPSPSIHLQAGWAVAIAVLWLLASVVRLVRLAAQALRLRRIWQEAVPIQPSATIQDILVASGREPRLCTSHSVDAPSVLGFLAPRLLIPEWLYPALTEPDLRQIALHECEHLRRRDDWINLFQKIALALFPLNPALFFADRRLSLERELACDARVVAETASRLDYAASLTRLAERRLMRRTGLTLALSAWSRQSELARRVHRLLRPTGAMSAFAMRASLALLTLSAAAGSIEFARAPRLLSFAAPVAETATSAQPLTEPVRIVPVAYRQPASPATFSPPTSAKLHALPRARRIQPEPPVQNLEATASTIQPQTRLLLTFARHSEPTEQPAPAQRLVWTDLSPAYAAVRISGGWLIIQL